MTINRQYPIAEIFESIQGEGLNAGVAATFIRFAGCNLSCAFCDTNFRTSQLLSKEEIALRVSQNFVVITGGEPLLYSNVLPELMEQIQSLRPEAVFELETNGTIALTVKLENLFHYVSLSPKVSRNRCKLDKCTSLKILFPYLGDGITAADFETFTTFERFIQPIDNKPMGLENFFDSGNTEQAVEEVKRLGFPWRLGTQLQKILGMR